MILSRTTASGEALLVVTPFLPKSGPPVIMVHGAEGAPNGAWAWTQYPTRTKVPRGCLDAGRLIHSPELGGNYTWGNPTCQARIDDAYARLGASKVVLAAQSMGGPGALTWAANNPSKVAGVIATIPVLHLGSILDSGYAADLNAAYGGSYSDETWGDYSPVVRARRGTFPAVPLQIWYGTTDTLCLPQYAVEFIGLTGAEGHAIPDGHAESTVDAVSSADVTRFILNL